MITVKSKKGFSLTELLVVIAIIGILSILVIPAYSNYVTRTRLTEALTVLDGYKKRCPILFYCAWCLNPRTVRKL
ncbi:prepilin-type N-terminal cleavage/methylation domain-containing protein [Francisella tularensis subsp. holarctica]|uniref:Prepilin-type N-terminal cleavage/methylation domain-containing protein n=2 Tax=Francisella tularensis subsp. holarctica TaxID=119857 RepID=A0ABF7PR63_FRATH|nr:prepilin-type N-terminal cleavage/methylation domain-containing protein [Francisella tularensis]CAJ78831.1 hypothetical protein FTL_0391 [Francisella tularensis subsp. holarctica LVS]AAX14623.1 truncated PilE3 [Francisella tularensis subsp. holarctica]AAX14626.1 truncated PilE3 [Francisella tularensis subsp. holarctica]MBZ5730225.1 prepilin-type N-terminal cleavage/methylation domain-containing protein [Francisella tularensis]MBZ5731929.1 prepilin-type N-terminal cleavage/methylation domain